MSSEMNYEARYWELRKEYEQAFDRWLADPQNGDSHQKFLIILTIYQDFCVEALEKLMDVNPNALLNL